VIAEGVKLAAELLENKPTALLLLGSYSIGKEKLFLAVAEALNERIYASREKTKLLRAAGCDMRRFVSSKEEARFALTAGRVLLNVCLYK